MNTGERVIVNTFGFYGARNDIYFDEELVRRAEMERKAKMAEMKRKAKMALEWKSSKYG